MTKYAQYLKSDEWREKRAAIRLRSLGRCEFCGAAMEHVHHVKYPKHLGTEPLDDLVAVCSRCHSKSHGVKSMTDESIEVPAGRPVTVKAMTGKPFTICAGANGNAYATADTWVEAIDVPRARRANFTAGLVGYAARKSQGRLLLAQFNGMEVIAWQVVARALDSVHAKYRWKVQSPRPVNAEETPDEWAALVKFIDRIDDMKDWGYDLQSNALASLIAGNAPVVAAPATLDQQIAAIALGYMKHGERIDAIEAVVLRDGSEWITTIDGCGEVNANPAEITQGRMNLEQHAGNMLKTSGAASGPSKKRVRLAGCSVITDVSIWRRADVYRAIGQILGKDFSALIAAPATPRLIRDR